MIQLLDYGPGSQSILYLIPIKICAPLIFAHLKGASLRSTNAQKLKGEEEKQRMNEKRQIYSKIRVRED